MPKEEFDIFNIKKTYPSADAVFATSQAPLGEVLGDCIFVLDTNVLLVPFSTSSESLAAISSIFTKLKEKSQLVIPGQVAREFANNRPTMISDIYNAVNQKKDGLNPVVLKSYPLLEDVDGYQQAKKIEKEIAEVYIRYRLELEKVVSTMKAWEWNDPVSLIYRAIFTADVILDIQVDESEVKKELAHRILHKIPPGYKDSAKDDDGIGDLLIWLTILELGKQKKNVILVSGETKPDWYHKSNKQPLYPRFELLTEFQNASDKHAFHIIRFSELLQLMGAEENVINEIAVEETISTSQFKESLTESQVEQSIVSWYNRNTGIRKVISEFDPIINLSVTFVNGSVVPVIIININNFRNSYQPLIITKIQLILENYEAKYYSGVEFVVVLPKDYSLIREVLDFIENYIAKIGSIASHIRTSYGFINEEGEFIQII